MISFDATAKCIASYIDESVCVCCASNVSGIIFVFADLVLMNLHWIEQKKKGEKKLQKTITLNLSVWTIIQYVSKGLH